MGYETTKLLSWSLFQKNVLDDFFIFGLIDQLIAFIMNAFTDLVVYQTTVLISGYFSRWKGLGIVQFKCLTSFINFIFSKNSLNDLLIAVGNI